jgi:hypothetical protein
MLGWEFFIRRQDDEAHRATRSTPTLARWQAGIGGTQWLDDLVSKGVAADLGGNGYPNRYTLPVGVVVSVLAGGLPRHSGPLVIGDDYVLPGGWTGNAQFDIAQLKSLDPNEILLVEAWDQS